MSIGKSIMKDQEEKTRKYRIDFKTKNSDWVQHGEMFSHLHFCCRVCSLLLEQEFSCELRIVDVESDTVLVHDDNYNT
jgi:hypothetical protein